MKRIHHCMALLMSAALASPAAAGATIYEWRDGAGGIHYSQAPPSGAPARRVTIRHDGVSNEAAAAKLASLLREAGLTPEALAQAKRERAQRRDEAAARNAAALERRRECVTATHALETLRNRAKRILVTGSDGAVTTMDNDKRESAIAHMQHWVSANGCR